MLLASKDTFPMSQTEAPDYFLCTLYQYLICLNTRTVDENANTYEVGGHKLTKCETDKGKFLHGETDNCGL